MEEFEKIATERAEMGWDRDQARSVLAQSINTIEVATRMAHKAIVDSEKLNEDFKSDISSLRSMVKALQDEGISGSRKAGNITRSQATSIVSLCGKILSSLDTTVIIKSSLDLTNQTRVFVDMMDKIGRRYGEEDKIASEDITSWLTVEQLSQVYEWVQERKLELLESSS